MRKAAKWREVTLSPTRVKRNTLPLFWKFLGTAAGLPSGWHWSDVTGSPVGPPLASVETNGFHGEYFAFTGPCITRRHPVSFFRLSSTGIGTNRQAQAFADV